MESSPESIASIAPARQPLLRVPARLDAAAPRWRQVERCPACYDAGISAAVALPGSAYVFGAERVAFPDSGIEVVACARCFLVYKTVVPEPGFLAEVFARQAGRKWLEPYDFAPEVAQIRRIVGEEIVDVLDVGASGGALLKACAAAGVCGRRSALDVVPLPGLERHLAGEFIRGFLDQPLAWSGVPYQVVTLFDVLEHLYDPQLAFDNLRELVRDGGYVFIETGDVASRWPTRYGAAQWWYVRLIEHHLFWSRRSLERIVGEHGFRILFWEERRHKSRAAEPVLHATLDLLKVGVWRAAPITYSGLAGMLGKEGAQPWSPLTRDHFRVCLRKV